MVRRQVKPRYACAVPLTQAIAFALLHDVLNSTRAADITATVKALDVQRQDTLMKYLYKGMDMARAPDAAVSCAVLLSWHEKVRKRSWCTDVSADAGGGHRLHHAGDERPPGFVDC